MTKTINSRNKGAAGEREFAGLIADHLGVRMVRNLVQAREGGCDLVVHPDAIGPVADDLRAFAIEVKRCARATESTLRGFWQQATEQADSTGKLPLLAYREDRQGWRVVMPLGLLVAELADWNDWRYTVALSVEGFSAVIRESAAGGVSHKGEAGDKTFVEGPSDRAPAIFSRVQN